MGERRVLRVFVFPANEGSPLRYRASRAATFRNEEELPPRYGIA